MTYKCLNCGHLFEEGEEAVWEEDRGEYWGVRCSEQMSGCPMCKGEYEETVGCKVCGSRHLYEELNGGVCDDCINTYKKDFNMCYKISFGQTETIEINALLASFFDVGDIEAILKMYILKKCPDADFSEFIEQDITWFGERVAEEVSKNEKSKD